MYVFPGTRKCYNFSDKVKTGFPFSLSLTGSVRQSTQSTHNVRLLCLEGYTFKLHSSGSSTTQKATRRVAHGYLE